MKYNSFKKQRKSKKSKKSKKNAWTPLVRFELTNEYFPDVDVSSLEYDEYWRNDEYIVKVYYPNNPSHQFPNNKFTWLCFRNVRNTHTAHDWRDMQMMKNEICGEERTAVEVFPPMSKLVDTCNQFHLWVYPEDYELDFGYKHQEIYPNAETVKEATENYLANRLAKAETVEEKNDVANLAKRLIGDPTFGKQRPMSEHFLSPELMDKLGYRYERGDDK
jgi:hypothetical protein